MKNHNIFADIPLAPADPILGVTEKFLADQNPKKVNLGVGVYQNAEGKALKLQAIKKAEAKLLETDLIAGYGPIDGLPDFVKITQALIFGENSEPLTSQRVATAQSPGGTGAIRLGAELLRHFLSADEIWLSDPSWENHKAIFEATGLKVNLYPYYDSESKTLNFQGCIDALSKAKEGAVVLLHASCHNPTGYDFTKEQWKVVLDTVQKRNLIPFLDMAYQGFSEGITEDAQVIRDFAAAGVQFLLASSYSKNFGLYGERTGALSVVTPYKDDADRTRSQIKRIVRTIYSVPPLRGAKIVQVVMNDPLLRSEWENELTSMRLRMKEIRSLFVSKLKDLGAPQDFSHVLRQNGMFSYSGIRRETVLWLRENKSLYALESGRICVAALNNNNIDFVCESITEGCKAV